MKRCKNEPLTEIERFCLDSLVIGGNVDLAYQISHPNSKVSNEYLHTLALRWQRSEVVKAYITQQASKVLFVGDKTAEQRQSCKIDYTQRSNLIQALSDAANNESDTIRRTKILSELADLQRMDRQDEAKDDKDLVHFYLPLTCKRCNLYRAERERKEKEMINDK
jgi:replication initiation and membrane attachment protein DnaB